MLNERECKTNSEARETIEGEHKSYACRKGSCIAAVAAAAAPLKRLADKEVCEGGSTTLEPH